MIYLNKQIVITINKATIEKHGGSFIFPHNFLHEENLDYLIEAVQSAIFGVEAYLEIHHKASFYMFNIISNHIFQDGNKRTGLEAAIIFLRLNGKNLDQSLPLKEIFDFTIKVASGKSSLEECQEWFAMHFVSEYL